MHTTQAGIDIAKSVFEVALSDTPGVVHERHRLSRERFRRFFSKREATAVLMEACGSAHYWGRELQAMGHQVRLLHPGDVARYRDGNKTDRADAKAVLEAARNAAIDPVPVKSREQQAIAALHRLRQGYMQTRTARINAVRGHLREFGIVIPVPAPRPSRRTRRDRATPRQGGPASFRARATRTRHARSHNAHERSRHRRPNRDGARRLRRRSEPLPLGPRVGRISRTHTT